MKGRLWFELKNTVPVGEALSGNTVYRVRSRIQRGSVEDSKPSFL
jgi:hypothetical protein